MIAVREATEDDARGIARVGVDTWRSAYKGIMSDEHLAGLSYSRNEEKWRRRLQEPANNRVIFVAEDEQARIVGYAGAGPEHEGQPGYDAELYGIYVLEQYQNQGIGRRLVGAVAQALADAGYSSLITWTLAEGAARVFYQIIGAQQVATQTSEIGGTKLELVAFGWPDIGALTGQR